MDYAALLDRIMPTDKFDPPTLEKFESSKEELIKTLEARKLPHSDDVVDELQQACGARLRFLGV